MAFTAITTGEIATGQPVTNTTLTTIKNDLDYINSQVSSLSLTIAQPPIIFSVNGIYTNNLANGILKTTLNFNLTVTGVFLLIDIAGSSGTTQVDLKYKRGAGIYTSFLTAQPSVIYTAGNDSISSNAVLNAGQVNLLAGDILRLDLISVQTAGQNFLVRVDYLKS